MRRTTVIGVAMVLTTALAAAPVQAMEPSPANHGLVEVGPLPSDPQPVDEDLAMAYHEALLQAEQHPYDFGYPAYDTVNRKLIVTPVTATGSSKVDAFSTRVTKQARQSNRTFAQLEGIKDDLTFLQKRGVPDADAIFRAERDTDNNRVIVTVERASDKLFAELVKRYGKQAVAVRVDPNPPKLSLQSGTRQNDKAPFYGGATFFKGSAYCTSGFPWVFGGTYALLTAGHCYHNEQTASVAMYSHHVGYVIPGSRENWIEGVGNTYFPNQSTYAGDLALVAVTTNGSVEPAIYRGSPTSGSSARIHDRWNRRPMVADQYCTGGRTTGEICGWSVESVAIHVRYEDSGNFVHNISMGKKTGACTDGGDSGGPVYTVRPDGKIAAKGIHSGGGLASLACLEFFTDIWDAYYALPGDVLTDSTVVTGAAPVMLHGSGGTSTMFRWRSANTSFPRDSDWTTSGYTAALVGNRMVSGDFNGDGYDDVVTAYDYGPDFRFHMFLNGTNYTGPTGWYTSGSFDVDKVGGRMVAGNWNGDAYDDIGMLYDAGNGSTRVYLWTSNGSSFSLYAQPSAFTNYSVANIGDRVAAGDVNNDGRDDIVVAYNTGGAFRFDVLFSGMNTPTTWYTSGAFTVSAAGNRFVVGDFDDDGDAEPAMFYDYGGGHARLFKWNSANGSFGLDVGWEVASGYTLSLVGGRMAADDVNGDGADDIVTVYDYGPDFRYHVFLNGYQYQGPAGWYTSGSFELANVSDRLVLGRW